MAWIANQTWSNQKIFTSGFSANGITQYLQPLLTPPWLKVPFFTLYKLTFIKGQAVGVASAQVHDSMFQGGAFRAELVVNWTYSLPEVAGLSLIYNHEPDSSYWASQDMSNKWSNVHAPGVHWTGWYDIFLQQNIDAYMGYQHNSSVAGYNYLIINPGGHCTVSEIDWPDASAAITVLYLTATKMFYQLNKSDNLDELKTALNDTAMVYYYILGNR